MSREKNAIRTLSNRATAYPQIEARAYRWKVSAASVGRYWVFIDVQRSRIWAGKSKDVSLDFTIANRGAASGRIVSYQGKTWLAHKGHLGGNQNPVSSEELIRSIRGFKVHKERSDDQSLILICDINSRNPLQDIVRFATLCDRVRAKKETQGGQPSNPNREREAISTGGFKGGTRAEIVFEAKHAPIVKALRETLSRGWKPVPAKNFAADLVCGKNGRRVLFEIKPDIGTHNLICAIGQCEVYNHDYKAHRKIIVALREGQKVAGQKIQKVLNNMGIELILAKKLRGGEFQFEFAADDELVR